MLFTGFSPEDLLASSGCLVFLVELEKPMNHINPAHQERHSALHRAWRAFWT